MYSAIQTGNNVGMQTLDQNLTDLVRRNVISSAEAAARPRFRQDSRQLHGLTPAYKGIPWNAIRPVPLSPICSN
jgi:hypothetical protein